MGWKSTVDISRDEAIRLIHKRLNNIDELSNEELSEMLGSIGYGDDVGLKYLGCNFYVTDKEK